MRHLRELPNINNSPLALTLPSTTTTTPQQQQCLARSSSSASLVAAPGSERELTPGNQGSSVARALTEQPGQWDVYGLTRNPDSESAKAIAALGVTLVKGDLEDSKSYSAALEGSYAAFIVANCEPSSLPLPPPTP